MDKASTCCFTGHRPDKLPWGSRESDPRCLTLKNLGGRFAPQGTVDQLYKAFGLDARSVADSVEEMLHEQ